MRSEVAKHKSTKPQESSSEITIQNALIGIVQRSDIDPDRLEKFLDLQIKMEDRQAEKDFNFALNKFQKMCPNIVRSKKVQFKQVDYSYAPLDEIVSIIKPFLSKTGLSFSFDMELLNDNDAILITTIKHIKGAQKKSRYIFSMIHDDQRMNISQRRKAAITQAKREGLEDALGIATTDADDDARRAVDELATEEQIELINSLMVSTGTNEEALLAYIKLPSMDYMSKLDAKRVINALNAKRGQHVQKNQLHSGN